VGRTRLSELKLRDLVQHFNCYRPRDEDFEFPDLFGAAYEYLIKQFADSAGKKGGTSYTPRAWSLHSRGSPLRRPASVVRLGWTFGGGELRERPMVRRVQARYRQACRKRLWPVVGRFLTAHLAFNGQVVRRDRHLTECLV